MEQNALNKTIKLDGLTKFRLDQRKENSETYCRYITRMLDFFDALGIQPDPRFKDPYIMVEKHLTKIESALQKDIKKYFQPALDFIENGGTLEDRDEKLCKLANENQDLRRLIKQLKEDNQSLEYNLSKASSEAEQKVRKYKAQLFGLKSLIAEECNPSRFEKSLIGSELKVAPSFFDKLNEKIEREYPTEEI